MRILFLSINYWPDTTGIAAFNIWRCEYLAARGHQVTICTGPPYYPQWRVPAAYRGRLLQREERNGVRILRSWMYVPQVLSTKKRVLHEATFLAGSLARALATRRPDLIFVVSPPLGLGLSASFLSRLWRVPCVFDVEDLQPDAAVELGMMRPGRMVDLLYRVERIAYRNAALLSTITEGMRQRIVAKGFDPARVTLFPPRADSALYGLRQRESGADFRRRYGLQGKFLVTHSGNMGVKQGMEVILDAAALSSARPDILYLLVGDGAMRAKLQEQASARQLRNVRFLPILDDAEFREMLAATDLALITQQKVVSDIVFPSKTVTLLSAGCPIVAAVNLGSEVAHAVVNSAAGRVVEPENPALLWQAVASLSAAPADLEAMRQRATQYATECWDERRTLPRMEAELEACVARWQAQH
ncbi:MAG: WcaI family glycosyltransferase [Acidobacteriota bacterium]|nr:WcaI family glycosyltransferase [Acidobacteriota bacterium]